MIIWEAHKSLDLTKKNEIEGIDEHANDYEENLFELLDGPDVAFNGKIFVSSS